MGVHKLWEILEPAKQIIPLDSIVGQRLCIDLSIWIIQLNKVNGGNVKDKPHLRGLFHRIRALMALNCHLVFVTDGAIPAIKSNVYRQRLAGRTQSGPSQKLIGGPLKRNKGSEFGRMIEEAKALSTAFGFPCIVSLEEGEAQCAALNTLGLCEACFTADSDSLLFGAELVYKDITLAGDGYVTAYDMAKIRSQLGYGKKSLIALGVLLGCDYFPGVRGLGPEKAQQIVKKFGEDKILDIMMQEGPVTLARRLMKTSKSKCSSDKENSLDILEDDKIASLAISAYMNPKCHSKTSESVQSVLLAGPIKMDAIRKICLQDFAWPFEKTDEYVLPKVAERDLQRMLSMQLANRVYDAGLQYKISEVVKKRQVRGVEYFEVTWLGEPEIPRSLVRAEDVQRAYPFKVVEFFAKIASKGRGKTTLTKKANELAASMQTLSLERPVLPHPENFEADFTSDSAVPVKKQSCPVSQESSRHWQQINGTEIIDLTSPPRPGILTERPQESYDDDLVALTPDVRHRERVRELKSFIAKVKERYI